MKGKAFLITQGSYPYYVLVSVAQTDTERLKSIKKLLRRDAMEGFEHLIPSDDDARTVVFPDGDIIIALRQYPKDAYWKGALTHEIAHAVFKLFSKIGITLTESSEEAFTYQQDYLTTEIYRRLK